MADNIPDWAKDDDTPDWARNPVPGEPKVGKTTAGKLARGAQGVYMEGVSRGLISQPVRKVMEMAGVGLKELREKYPGQTDAWYKENQKKLLKDALQIVRDESAEQVRANRIGVPEEGTKPTIGDRAARLGQQTLNVGGSIAAAPEWWAVPGLGVGGGTATKVTAGIGNEALRKAAATGVRLGSTAAAEGAVGGLSDAAAQGMDIQAGMQDEFDWKRAGMTTAASAAFGAGARGVIEAASPFVKSLYDARGKDTTPDANPFGIKAMPEEPLQQNAADAQAYNDLLQTGSVDDIRAFFADKPDGPDPRDIDEWVRHRDGETRTGPIMDEMKPQFDYETHYNDKAKAEWAQQNNTAVTEHVAKQTAKWKNAPEYEIVSTPHAIADPEIRDSVLKDDPNGEALGVFGKDGKVRIFTDRIPDADIANSVLFHESLAHYGLAEKFGARLDQVLASMLKRNVNQFSKLTDKWIKDNPGAYGGNRIRAAEEVLAKMSEKGPLSKSWTDALESSMMKFGRDMGLDLAYSDAEIRHILQMSHDAVINGKPSALANGFRGAVPSEDNQNKFVFTGPRAKDFDPDHPTAFTPKDGVRRNEIDDSGAKLKLPKEGIDPKKIKLEDVLDHSELFKQYPQLKRVRVEFEYMPKDLGAYQPGAFLRDPKIILNPYKAELSHVLHEVQHAVQDIEKYGTFKDLIKKGGTAKLDDAEYRDLPSEKEARLTEDRADMNVFERAGFPVSDNKFMRARKPDETSDILEQDALDIARHVRDNYVPNRVSKEEVRRQALEYSISPSAIKDLAEWEPGEAAARLARIGEAAKRANAKARTILDKLDTPEWKLDDYVRLGEAIANRNYLVERFLGEGNEYGRALATIKSFKEYTNGNLAELIARLDEDGSGIAGLLDPANPNALKFARMLKAQLASGNTKGANVLMAGINKPYWEQYLTSYHMNAMLAGMSTQFKAGIDTGTAITREIIEKAASIPVTKLRQMVQAMQGKPIDDGVTVEELLAHIAGLFKAVTDFEMYKQSLKTLKTGQGAYRAPDGTTVPINFANQYGTMSAPRIPGVNIPLDMLAAQDVVWRSVTMSTNLYSLGVREARKQLGKGASKTDVMTLGAALAHNPSKEMLDLATDLSSRTLLMNHNRITDAVDKWKVNRPGQDAGQRALAFAIQNLFPFIRTQANSLFERVIRRSPLAIFDKYTQEQFKAGGAQADIAMTKILYGFALMWMYWNSKDNTGEQSDNPAKRKELEAFGDIPRAQDQGDKYVDASALPLSLNPLDARNSTAATVRSLREAWEKGANEGQFGSAFMLTFGSLISNLTNQTWVSEATPLGAAVTGMGERGEATAADFAAGQARSWVPNIASQAARMMDGEKRDTEYSDPNASPLEKFGSRVANEVKSTIPGLRETLPVKNSVYGDPLQQGTSLTGVNNKRFKSTDPTQIELHRLATSGLVIEFETGKPIDLRKSALITPVTRIEIPDGEGDMRKITTRELQDYQKRAGQYIIEDVAAEMSNPEWQSMSDQDKVLLIKDIQTKAKKAAREELFYGADESTDELGELN